MGPRQGSRVKLRSGGGTGFVLSVKKEFVVLTVFVVVVVSSWSALPDLSDWLV